MRTAIALLFLLLAATCFAQKAASSKPGKFASLDTALARVLTDWKAAGFAVAIVEKNRVIYSRGFGYKNVEEKTPVTPNTLFAIGSCTKAFTSSLIGLLNKDELVEYDKPVRTYLPALNFYNNDMNDHVTLRDMMCHRTGVTRFDYSWYFFPSRSKDSLMKRVQYMEPSEPLRQKWQYNNFMFMLQGLVAEKLTGKSWEANIRERIFKKLGMDSSALSLSEWVKGSDIAVGYGLKKDSLIYKMPYYDISGMAPAGSINSSVNDMAKWLITWINGGKYNSQEILPSPYVAEAISPQMVVSSALPGKKNPDLYFANYGFGWMLSSYRGHYRVEHGGNIDGFSANTSFFPSDSIGIVVLCNQNGSAVPGIVRNIVADRMLGLPYKDWQSELFSADTAGRSKAREAAKTSISSQKKGTHPSHALKSYEGIYTSPAQETFVIDMKNDSLFMFVPNRKVWLRHYHYDIFDLLDDEDRADNDTGRTDFLRIMFRMDEKGDIASASLPLEGPARPIIFNRKDRVPPLTKDSLQKFTGDYNLNGVTVQVYLKKDRTLFVFVPGQPEYELEPTSDKYRFNIKVLPGYSVRFAGNEKGAIAELLFVQPNGTFKATKVVKM